MKESLELEVNKRLNLRTFHLDNYINQNDHHQRFPHKRHTDDAPAYRILPTIGCKMKQETEQHQCKDFPITFQQLRE